MFLAAALIMEQLWFVGNIPANLKKNMKAQSLVVVSRPRKSVSWYGKILVREFPLYRETLEEASDACSLDFKKLSFDASESEIRDTDIAQPPTLTAFFVGCGKVLNPVFPVFQEKVETKNLCRTLFGRIHRSCVCGCFGVRKKHLNTVRLRGRFMKEACPIGLRC
jgi:hypothetical protein